MSNKVLLVLADGMRPDSISKAEDPEIRAFFESGNYSYTAQTTDPPITLPCHMSLFHSIPAERHGIYTNTFIPMNHPVNGLFEVLAQAKKVNAIFYSWQPLRDLYRSSKAVAFSWMMNLHHYWKERNLDIDATEACRQYMLQFQPDFCFLYLGMTDEYGHKYGWMSSEYVDCVRTATNCVRRIASALPPEYSVIFTADHGGHDRNHGDNVPEDMTIPLCCFGPMFESGEELKGPVSIMDIAPTVTEILGVEPDPEWEGKSLIGR